MSEKNENNDQEPSFIQRISLNVEANQQSYVGIFPKKYNETMEKNKYSLSSILKTMGLTLNSDLEFSSSNKDDLTFDKQTFKTLNLFSHIPKERTTKLLVKENDEKNEPEKYLLGTDVVQSDHKRTEDLHALINYYVHQNHLGKEETNHDSSVEDHDSSVEDLFFRKNILMWGLQKLFITDINFEYSILLNLNINQLAALFHFYQLNEGTVDFAMDDVSLVNKYFQEKEDKEIDHDNLHKHLLRNHFERLCGGNLPHQTDSLTIDQLKSLIQFYRTNEKESDRITFHEQLMNKTKNEKKNIKETKKETKETQNQKKTDDDDNIVTNMKYFFDIPDDFKPKKYGQICEDTLKFWHHM